MHFGKFMTPLGEMFLQAQDNYLAGAWFLEHRDCLSSGTQEIKALIDLDAKATKEAGLPPILEQAKKELNLFFSGELKVFKTPLTPKGTPFQEQVWQALLAIPYGKTVSYADIAKSIGKELAVRAVGTAIGRNPISVIIPCHRVIGKNGTLTGYADGLERKKCLLDLESGKHLTLEIYKSTSCAKTFKPKLGLTDKKA